MRIDSVNRFAYDGCHKIYLLESDEQEKDAIGCGYKILPVEDLKKPYGNSCSLRFIAWWDLDKDYVCKQFEVMKWN